MTDLNNEENKDKEELIKKPKKGTNALTHLLNAILFFGIGGATLYYANNVKELSDKAQEQVQQLKQEELDHNKKTLDELEKIVQVEASKMFDKMTRQEKVHYLANIVEEHTAPMLQCDKEIKLNEKDTVANLANADRLFKEDEVFSTLRIVPLSKEMTECKTTKGIYSLTTTDDADIAKTAEEAKKAGEQYIYMPIVTFLDNKPLFTVFHKTDLNNESTDGVRVWRQSWWKEHRTNLKIDFGENAEHANPRTFE